MCCTLYGKLPFLYWVADCAIIGTRGSWYWINQYMPTAWKNVLGICTQCCCYNVTFLSPSSTPLTILSLSCFWANPPQFCYPSFTTVTDGKKQYVDISGITKITSGVITYILTLGWCFHVKINQYERHWHCHLLWTYLGQWYIMEWTLLCFRHAWGLSLDHITHVSVSCWPCHAMDSPVSVVRKSISMDLDLRMDLPETMAAY